MNPCGQFGTSEEGKAPSVSRCELRFPFLVTKSWLIFLKSGDSSSLSRSPGSSAGLSASRRPLVLALLPPVALPAQRTAEVLENNPMAGACPAPPGSRRCWAPRVGCAPFPGHSWPFLCRDELRDEQLLDSTESAEHELEGEGGTKAQSKGLLFKIASKPKCDPPGCPGPRVPALPWEKLPSPAAPSGL